MPAAGQRCGSAGMMRFSIKYFDASAADAKDAKKSSGAVGLQRFSMYIIFEIF